jgi:hypothetical protein
MGRWGRIDGALGVFSSLDRVFLLLNITTGMDWQDDTEVPGWLVDKHIFGLGDKVTLRNSILYCRYAISVHALEF